MGLMTSTVVPVFAIHCATGPQNRKSGKKQKRKCDSEAFLNTKHLVCRSNVPMLFVTPTGTTCTRHATAEELRREHVYAQRQPALQVVSSQKC